MAGFMDDAAQAALWASAHARILWRRSRSPVSDGPFGGRPYGRVAVARSAVFRGGGPRIRRASPASIGLSGPYDFLPLLEPDVQDMFGPPDLYPESQPINSCAPDAPPMLLVHGLRDDRLAEEFAQSRDRPGARASGGRLSCIRIAAHADTVAALSVAGARARAPTLADVADVRRPASDAQAAWAAAGAGIE